MPSIWNCARRLALAATLVAVSLLPAAGPAAAAGKIIHVRAGATGVANGTTWARAYPSLPVAIAAAAAGDEIWVARGTYTPTASTDRGASFVLRTGVAIYGGFAGTETRRADRIPARFRTILSGEIGNAGSTEDNSFNVVRGDGVTASAILDGFRIQGGAAFGGTWYGGGIFLANASPILRNLMIRGNAAMFGGGIAAIGGAPVLSNVTVSGNLAQGNLGNGGGIYASDSSLQLRNVTIATNASDNGGGLLALGGTTVLRNVTIADNTARFFNGTQLVTTTGLRAYNTIIHDDDPRAPVIAGAGAVMEDSVVRGGCPDGVTCTRVADGDPMLGTLRENGGWVPTMAPGWSQGESVAVDRGASASCLSADARGVARPQGSRCDIGAYEVNVLTLRSAAAQDGWIRETARGSGRGGLVDGSSATLRVGDDASNREYRTILSFATQGIPDSATIQMFWLRARSAGHVGTKPGPGFAIAFDLRRGRFGSSSALQPWDFSATASASAAGFLLPVAGGWFAGTAEQAALLSRTSTTQFRLRIAAGSDGDSAADYVKLASGNGAAASRPLLVVYWVP